MKWFDILKKRKNYSNIPKGATGSYYEGAKRPFDNEFNEQRMKRAREFLDDEEEGRERDSKRPVPKGAPKGAFIKKPKPKQPQSKFADANPDKEPPNPFKKK
tara:strand:+ start:242 stop:547 length:306 start_codon:yes stop_codon:yes gene_type:complete